ncbi:MAG: hypothetical protein E7560_01675 [Ruminococcaceae bacterium]|nr:hypothetical protein [Oscillospiraceae bacterium]
MEQEILKARLTDTLEICSNSGKPKFLGFLSMEQSVYARLFLESRFKNFVVFGGYENAERVMVGCFPEWMEEKNFPIDAITITFRKNDKLYHKDFLGSLMALGLKREAIGDILIEEGRAVIFVSSDITKYVLTQIEKIGRTGVAVCLGFKEPLPRREELLEFSSTVSSERLDCVVAALCSISRTQAVEKILEGLVSVNSIPCEKVTKALCEGDVVTVRTKGKFIIEALSEKTRKNKIILRYKKYV